MTRSSTPERWRIRDLRMLGVPAVIIIVALYHLAMCNSTELTRVRHGRGRKSAK